MIGLNRLGRDIWAKVLFFVLAVVAFLFLGVVVSQAAGASVIGTDETVTEAPEEAVADASSDIVTEALADAVTESVGEEIAPDDLPGIPEDVVEEVVETIEDSIVNDRVENPGVSDEGVFEDRPASLGEDIGSVADIPLVEEIPVVIDEVSSGLDDELSLLPPAAVDLVAKPTVQTPEVAASYSLAPKAELPAAINDVAVAGSGLSLQEAFPTGEASQPRSLPTALFGEQLGAELALFRLSNLTAGAVADTAFSSSPGDETGPGLAPYTPLPGRVAVERGSGGSSSSSASHAGGGLFGGIDPYGFFAAMSALSALCLVGWIRDRSRSGRSIFPSHGGRPG